MTRVSLIQTEPNLKIAVAKAIESINERLICAGDSVLIKPNLVEPADPDSGVITAPRLIEAVARYCLERGASRVIVGEGPSYYQPQSCLRECFTRTGVSEVCRRLGIEWVLFDEHGYRTFAGVPGCMPEKFRVTEFAFVCDKFINLPVLKTHYLTTVTLAMKNLKGCLKREDKPLFHYWDLNQAIVELGKIIKPTINIIDGTAKIIARQLGSGYSKWKQAGSGLLITGSDIVAVDAVGCALMGIDPSEVRTVYLGAAAGLGENNLARIDIFGEEIKQLKFRIKLPQEELRDSFPLLEIRGAEKACSGCLIPLLSGLILLRERGIKLDKRLVICLGRSPEVPRHKKRLLVGDCALAAVKEKLNGVVGCPPSREELLSKLIRLMEK